MEGDESDSPTGFVEGSFEDPRMWADVGLDDADFSIKGLGPDSEASSGEAWHERQIDEMTKKRTRPGEAIVAPNDEKTVEMTNPQQELAARAAAAEAAKAGEAARQQAQQGAQAGAAGTAKPKSEMGMRTRQMHAIEVARSPQMKEAAEQARAASAAHQAAQAAQGQAAQGQAAQGQDGQQLGQMPIQQVAAGAQANAQPAGRKRSDTGEIIVEKKKSNTGLYLVLLVIVVLLAAAAGVVFLKMNGQLPI
jgi:hypothetical protein